MPAPPRTEGSTLITRATRIVCLGAVLAAALMLGCQRGAPEPSAVVAPPAMPSTTLAVSANSVASYFTGAQIQAEGDAQSAELRRAFDDMLALNVDALKAQRYADYAGVKNVRPLVTLLNDHLVSATPRAIDPEPFFADIKAPEAQAAIRAKLNELAQVSKATRP
jgi:predicted nucleic acid-binding protein